VTASGDILGPGGALSEKLDGYEARAQQLDMADAVERAFQEKGHLVVEAATGTGKTLAYLIPAILSGKTVVISTATKALQEQIFQKDIPFLRELFQATSPKRAFKAVYLKGRSNYLCKFRYEEATDLRFRSREEIALFPTIRKWAGKTKTGDRSELKGLPDDYGPWSQLSATAAQCHGSDCVFHADCFVTRVRRFAQDADIVVVNHALFFADLAVRDAGADGILPDYDAIIFDEAHHLESMMTSYFGFSVSTWRVHDLATDIRTELDRNHALNISAVKVLNDLDNVADVFFGALVSPPGRHSLQTVLDASDQAAVDKRRLALDVALEQAGEWIATLDVGDTVERLHERCTELRNELSTIMTQRVKSLVYLADKRSKGIILEGLPLDVADLFRDKVLTLPGPQIFTSATLTAGGSFDFFLARLGMSADRKLSTLSLGHVFDYASNALVYIPNRLPAPNKPEFVEGVCTIVDYLVRTTEGRAFVLFTSYRNLDLVYNEMQEDFPYPLLRQGEAPKGELLQRFREDVSSVLFATHSFWEGVDVQGESLSLVIIDKLPFANPSDPLTKARMALLDDQGSDSFRDYSIPSAAISLRQGFGRLIRSQRDRGIVAILDSRIANRRYGRTFLDSLPPAPVVWNAKQARQWWQRVTAEDQ
jgi:ATP-dependent DNA helicase DinG